MKRVKVSDSRSATYEKVFDPIDQRDICIEHRANGETTRWLLDRCYQQLCAVPHTEERFPWSDAIASPEDAAIERSRVGKWLLFPGCATAVRDWTLIAAEMAKSAFWEAKISLTNSSLDEHGHVICVYTPDFCDVANVRSVGIRLGQLDLGAAQQRPEFYYKPDVFTTSDVYTDSGPASIYALRPGSTFLRKTEGFKQLGRNLRTQIDEAIVSLPVLPRGNLKRRVPESKRKTQN